MFGKVLNKLTKSDTQTVRASDSGIAADDPYDSMTISVSPNNPRATAFLRSDAVAEVEDAQIISEESARDVATGEKRSQKIAQRLMKTKNPQASPEPFDPVAKPANGVNPTSNPTSTHSFDDKDNAHLSDARPSNDNAMDPLPLYWPEASDDAPSRFEDLLTPLIIAAMTGQPVQRAATRDPEERLAAAIVAGPEFGDGVVHLWGAGVAGDRASRDRRASGFKMPKDACWIVHALRGPLSLALLSKAGVAAPPIFGDPLWFAPRVLPFDGVEKTVEIGVIAPAGHKKLDAVQQAAMRRLEIPDGLEGVVDIIDLECPARTDALEAMAQKIGRCKRLLVSTPKQLVLGEALGLPTALFTRGGGGVMSQRVEDDLVAIPSEARDIYAGFGAERLVVCRQPSGEPTRWEQTIRSIDAAWEPTSFDPKPLFDAFPTAKAATLDQPRWSLPANVNAIGEASAARSPSALAMAARIASSIGRANTRASEVDRPTTRNPLSKDARDARQVGGGARSGS